MSNTMKPFVITSVCKEDLLGIEKCDKDGNIIPFFNEDDVMNLSDSDMERIASKLSDDYCEQLFWSSLQIIGEYIIEQSKDKQL